MRSSPAKQSPSEMLGYVAVSATGLYTQNRCGGRESRLTLKSPAQMVDALGQVSFS
jgi:hypothetical protein